MLSWEIKILVLFYFFCASSKWIIDTLLRRNFRLAKRDRPFEITINIDTFDFSHSTKSHLSKSFQPYNRIDPNCVVETMIPTKDLVLNCDIQHRPYKCRTQFKLQSVKLISNIKSYSTKNFSDNENFIMKLKKLPNFVIKVVKKAGGWTKVY